MTLLSKPEMRSILHKEQMVYRRSSKAADISSRRTYRHANDSVLVLSNGYKQSDLDLVSGFLDLCGYSCVEFYPFPKDPPDRGRGDDVIELARRVSRQYQVIMIPSGTGIFKSSRFFLRFIGFLEGCSKRILYLPILKRESNRLILDQKEIPLGFPYLAWGRTFQKQYELFVLKEPGVYVDFEHWRRTEPDLVDWTKKNEPGTTYLPML